MRSGMNRNKVYFALNFVCYYYYRRTAKVQPQGQTLQENNNSPLNARDQHEVFQLANSIPAIVFAMTFPIVTKNS
jgi:hypothetical protein